MMSIAALFITPFGLHIFLLLNHGRLSNENYGRGRKCEGLIYGPKGISAYNPYIRAVEKKTL